MQKLLPKDSWLNPAECAERTGLTVRALRVYETHGLIAPRRTAANWRLYGPTEIARLMEIIALKRLGLSLARIATLLAGHASDIGSLLDMQESLLAERRNLAEQALRSIAAMRDKLATGGTPSTDELLRLLKETEMTDHAQETIAWRRYEQMRPRSEIKLDPTGFADYAGSYLLELGAGLTVVARDGRLYVRVTGQPEVEAFAEGRDRFFLKIVPAQIVFLRNDAGDVSGLELHQDGFEHAAPRVDDAVVAAIELELQQRISTRTPAAGGEALLRSLIAEHRQGTIDYDRMTPPLADAAREQREVIAADLSAMGDLCDVAFKGISRDGWDVYDVAFAKGRMEWSFVLAPDGKISGLLMRPSL